MAPRKGKIARLLEDVDPAKFADASTIPRETLWRWQRGKRIPTSRMLPLISLATNIPIETLEAARMADKRARRAARAAS